jgi:hypothetical protein
MNSNFYWATGKQIHAFWDAIDKGNLKALRKIVEENPKVLRWERGDCKTPIGVFAVAEKPTSGVLEYLLSLGFGIDGSTPEPYSSPGFKPINFASDEGNLLAVRELLKRGANLKLSGEYYSALHIAAMRGHAHIISALLKSGADPHQENKDKKLPLELAKKEQHKTCISILQKVTVPKKRKKFVAPPKATKLAKVDAHSKSEKIRQTIRRGVREFKKQYPKEKVTAIAIYGTAILGFVEIGFETKTFDPRKPDCAAEVSYQSMARIDFPQWKKDYKSAKKIELYYRNGAPLVKSPNAADTTLEKPFFSMLVDILKKAKREGNFDKLNLAPNCVLGVEIYYHTHCEFWNLKGAIVEKPEPWTTAKSPKPTKKAKTPKSKRPGISWSENVQLKRNDSGISISPDGAHVAGITTNSAFIWKLPRKTPVATIGGFIVLDDISFDTTGNYIFLHDRFEHAIYDMQSQKVISRAKKSLPGFYVLPAGPKAWIAFERYGSIRSAVLRKRSAAFSTLNVQNNSNVTNVHSAGNRICWQQHGTGDIIQLCSLEHGVATQHDQLDFSRILGRSVGVSSPRIHPTLDRLVVHVGESSPKAKSFLCLIEIGTRKI